MRLGLPVLASLKMGSHELAWGDADVAKRLSTLANDHSLDISGGTIRRTSSRFCFGVEHGDYNGTPLFGVGTDRYIWLAYKPNASGKCRILSGNYLAEGVVEFALGDVPPPLDDATCKLWARFPYGVEYVLRQNGLKTFKGFDAVLLGNIPGGGMSRSASLCINLLQTVLVVNGAAVKDDHANGMEIVRLAKQVENDYIGSPPRPDHDRLRQGRLRHALRPGKGFRQTRRWPAWIFGCILSGRVGIPYGIIGSKRCGSRPSLPGFPSGRARRSGPREWSLCSGPRKWAKTA
ncbi:hypothetical protein M885DRAFT_171698 [Pelagophyceae sp. CCMP2097]|nr:hypothetical protein M885DRAFT_171698 [Pelagophyceae sp. CCMP2097]